MRPPAPERAFEGCHWEAVEEDPARWRAIPEELARPCRQRKDRKGIRGTCRIPSTAALNRTPGGENWWHYCPAHTYGRWVEDTPEGPKVFSWRLTDDAPATA